MTRAALALLAVPLIPIGCGVAFLAWLRRMEQR